MSNNDPHKQPRRLLLYALALMTAVAALLFIVTLLAFPENASSFGLLLVVVGLAYVGASAFISGTYNAYTLLQAWFGTAAEPPPTSTDNPAPVRRETMMTIPEPPAPPTGTYYSCFISYATADQPFVEKLRADLIRHGVDVWFAPEDLRIGVNMRVAFDESILEKHKLLLILSAHSVNSDWVEKEVSTAFDKEYQQKGLLVLFPIRLDDAVMGVRLGWAADIRRMRNIGDFRQWQDEERYQKQLQRLLRDLKAG